MQSYKYRKYKVHAYFKDQLVVFTLDSYTKLFSAHCKLKGHAKGFSNFRFI